MGRSCGTVRYHAPRSCSSSPEEFLERYRDGQRPALKEYSDRYPEFTKGSALFKSN